MGPAAARARRLLRTPEPGRTSKLRSIPFWSTRYHAHSQLTPAQADSVPRNARRSGRSAIPAGLSPRRPADRRGHARPTRPVPAGSCTSSPHPRRHPSDGAPRCFPAGGCASTRSSARWSCHRYLRAHRSCPTGGCSPCSRPLNRFPLPPRRGHQRMMPARILRSVDWAGIGDRRSRRGPGNRRSTMAGHRPAAPGMRARPGSGRRAGGSARRRRMGNPADAAARPHLTRARGHGAAPPGIRVWKGIPTGADDGGTGMGRLRGKGRGLSGDRGPRVPGRCGGGRSHHRA